VVLVQSTHHPAGENLFELLLLADACHRHGAECITAVIPYLGYSRHDRTMGEGAPLGMATFARALRGSPIARLIVTDLHSASLEAALPCPTLHLSAVPLFAEALRRELEQRIPQRDRDSLLIVAPDFGAAKLADQLSKALQQPLAIVRKTRRQGTDPTVEGVLGEAKGRRPILIDDMISTGDTVAASIHALRSAGSGAPLAIVATHGLFPAASVKHSWSALAPLLLVSNSVPPSPHRPAFAREVPLGPTLAAAIETIA
jgi:ribose-phosphate pyrophosphokinase